MTEAILCGSEICRHSATCARSLLVTRPTYGQRYGYFQRLEDGTCKGLLEPMPVEITPASQAARAVERAYEGEG